MRRTEQASCRERNLGEIFQAYETEPRGWKLSLSENGLAVHLRSPQISPRAMVDILRLLSA